MSETVKWLEGYGIALYRDDGEWGRRWTVEQRLIDELAHGETIEEAVKNARDLLERARTP